MASESNVYDLFDGRPPSEPVDTSMMAALEALPNVGKQHRAVLHILHRRGSNGATDDELEVALQLSHQAVSARRRELVLKGLVRDSGRRRATRRGRQATVWEVGLDLTAEGDDGSPMVHVPTPAEIGLALRDMRRMWKAAREAGVGPVNPYEVAKVGSWLRAVAGEE